MKVGDKLYRLSLWEYYGRHQFQTLNTYTITKIKSKTIEVRGGRVKKLEIGWKFFTSKKAMYKYYLKKYKEEIKPTIRAIRLLIRRIKNEK